MFDLQRIAASKLVARVDHHEMLGSTSDRALELAAAGEQPLPLLVIAEHQTGGRGRGMNRWWSAAGALTFSLVLEADPSRLSPERWPQLSLVAGLAVCQTLELLLPQAQCRVKWPNDVFLNGRKVCGILCESVPGWRDRLVVGIGLNVNNSLATAPSEVRKTAQAMCDVSGAAYDRTAVLMSLLDRLDERWSRLASAKFAEIAAEYRQRCFLTDRTLTIVAAETTLVGRCQGIDDDGYLVLQTDKGVSRVIAGSIVAWDEW
jgi:BirA family biotin operon repressor/biotin-[acetyl-CoA-carboxylase] ligase